jgi:Zn-dependent peptidase ImmA (M78 family)
MTPSEFIDYAVDFCTKNKIKLEFSPEKSDCTGYFIHNPPEIYIYTNRHKSLWLIDLAHEIQHIKQ